MSVPRKPAARKASTASSTLMRSGYIPNTEWFLAMILSFAVKGAMAGPMGGNALNVPGPVNDQLRMLAYHAVHNVTVPADRLVGSQNRGQVGRLHFVPFDRLI